MSKAEKGEKRFTTPTITRGKGFCDTTLLDGKKFFSPLKSINRRMEASNIIDLSWVSVCLSAKVFFSLISWARFSVFVFNADRNGSLSTQAVSFAEKISKLSIDCIRKRTQHKRKEPWIFNVKHRSLEEIHWVGFTTLTAVMEVFADGKTRV